MIKKQLHTEIAITNKEIMTDSLMKDKRFGGNVL